MNTQQICFQMIRNQGLLPLFYNQNQNTCLSITAALYKAGIRVIEFTNRGEKAPEHFKAIVKAREQWMPDLLLAVGTIKTAREAQQFLDAGADMLISPIYTKSISDVAQKNKVLWIPGCMTPTEIHIAELDGWKMIKLFPGNVISPSFVKSIKPLFPQIDFVVTGGVDGTRQNLEQWFQAGVTAVGIGSKLIGKVLREDHDFELLKIKTKELIATISTIKSEYNEQLFH